VFTVVIGHARVVHVPMPFARVCSQSIRNDIENGWPTIQVITSYAPMASKHVGTPNLVEVRQQFNSTRETLHRSFRRSYVLLALR
jgi:hypothetical protein